MRQYRSGQHLWWEAGLGFWCLRGSQHGRGSDSEGRLCVHELPPWPRVYRFRTTAATILRFFGLPSGSEGRSALGAHEPKELAPRWLVEDSALRHPRRPVVEPSPRISRLLAWRSWRTRLDYFPFTRTPGVKHFDLSFERKRRDAPLVRPPSPLPVPPVGRLDKRLRNLGSLGRRGVAYIGVVSRYGLYTNSSYPPGKQRFPAHSKLA
jgi:hypothetical protein